ncbi:MAG: CvpA family protein [Velocimicrobium sp.]
MKKVKFVFLAVILILLIGSISYYIYLPALNIHSSDFWFFIIACFVIATIISVFLGNRLKLQQKGGGSIDIKLATPLKKNRIFKILLISTLLLFLVFIIGSILSSPIINARKYRDLIDIETRDFSEDVKEISFNDIPILDKDSAALLASRKMGSMVEFVSQFEVADNYAQINQNDTPVRVTPLKYANIFKWLTNRGSGLPAYMKIDMTTQIAECVKLSEGIKYSESEHFGRYIQRYLRFNYPTYIFDTLNFEVNDDGTPYWVCPVKDFTIGLFGGQSIQKVILVNAVTGELTNYNVADVPTWIDRVYSSELLISYYNYYGTLKHGYFNSLLSQKDCLQTTEGYNYIALDNDVWVYTGITSVTSDESIVGFVLMNQRTAETRYYSIAGAKEYSAMGSAEGKVQNLSYAATFPLLLNIQKQPTYFIALKDAAGLVKKYAMVNIQQYTVVAIGDTITECESDYITQLKDSNISVKDTTNDAKVTGTIRKISECVIDGNSHYFILLDGRSAIYDIAVSDNISIVSYSIGDQITLSYIEGTDYNSVTTIQ